MRVEEADDVAAGFLARQGPRAVGLDGGGLAADVPHGAGAPDAPAPLADERPAFFDGDVARLSHLRNSPLRPGGPSL
jgi:hypothetical protein